MIKKLENVIKVSFVLTLLIGAYGVFFSIPSESYIRDRVVKLINPKVGGCSGIQVHSHSGKDYILTAAHCAPLTDETGSIQVQLDGGRFIPRKVLEVSTTTDLMLLEGMPGLRGLDYAQSWEAGETLRSFTHGEMLDTYKTSGELIQKSYVDITVFMINDASDEAACNLPKYVKKSFNTLFGKLEVCALHLNAFITTAMTVPGSSGGGLVDNSGKIAAIVTGGDERFSVLVPTDDINTFLQSY